MREHLGVIKQPETLEQAVELTRYAGLRMIDDYVGYPDLQADTAYQIASELYKPDTDYWDRLITFEYVNRAATEPVDEVNFIDAMKKLLDWTDARKPDGLVRNICVKTTYDGRRNGYRTAHVSYDKPSRLAA
jgi:gamma-glutamylcyclotransferase (GGCT)/AIG2-like uncharacterized protein YtfP